jgi:hypothetical protein
MSAPRACGAALMLSVAVSPVKADGFVGDAAAACGGLAAPAQESVHIDSATLQAPSTLSVAEKAGSPAARIVPANPAFCKVLGHIAPRDANAPPIKFEVNLPVDWNGRSLQYGGGGFNGVLITGLGLPPAYPFDKASPLARGFVTYGTDSGHEAKPGEPPQTFALNDEAFENFAHVAYKKVRDAAVDLMQRAYGKQPAKMYFMGSSEGGREALTMAQRYPEDFDGIFARVPVINWVGLQHAGTRSGLVTMGEGWINPAQVKLVAAAVLKACDKADGAEDGLVANAVACKASFRPETLRCAAGQSGDQCLNDAQIKAIDTLHDVYKFPFALANGLDDYPGWGVSGEDTPPVGLGRRLDGVVARCGAAGAAARAQQRHRLDLWRRRHSICVRTRSQARRHHLQGGGSQGAAARGLQPDGLHQSRSQRLPRAWRQADHARTHGGLCAEPSRRHPLFRERGAQARQGRDRGVRAALHGAGRRSCRQRCAGQCRHAERAGRLGRERQGAG